jgi:uncharacterized ParB-like nuclease family protein
VTDLQKAVRRRTVGLHRGRRFVVVLEPGDVIGFRPERSRKVFYTSLAACFDLAVRQHAAAEKRAKAEARKARRA